MSQRREFQDDSRSRKEMRQTKEDTGSRDWKVRVVKTDWKEVSWVVGRKAFWMASCRSSPAA